MVKYQGLWFDKKLTRRADIKKLESKCKKVRNVMRFVSGLDCGQENLC